MSTGTESAGRALAEHLGLNIIGTEGHDIKCSCIACDSTDAMRVHQDTGVAFCYACQAKFSRLELAEKVLGDRPAAWRLLEQVGLEEPRHTHNGHHNGAPSALERVAKLKGISVESLKAFGASEAKRGAETVVRLPVYSPHGKQHSYFDLPLDGSKGLFKEGKNNSGLFFPGRLPEPGETWHLVEGPKDAAALHALGFNACGLPGSSMHPKFARLFAGVNVVIVPDRDQAGEGGAEKTAAVLYRKAGSIRVATLPVEFKQKGGADVRDVLKMPDGEQHLRQAIADARPWAPTASDTTEITITNAEVIGTGEDRQTVPLTMEAILERVRSLTENWPRRVDECLFVHDQHGVCWLTSAAAAFGWLGARSGKVYWRKGVGCATKEEVFHELRRTSRRYRAVENLPHEPMLDGHFYACPSVEPGAGDVLRELLDRFRPATPIDRDLIQAAVMTLFWGGQGGTRPVFVFTSDDGRGSGKTKGAERIGDVAGGVLHFAHNEAIGDIKARLLSPDALTKRAALLDNVKTLRFSWAELEALVTALEIGGKRMYVGEASRPNTITWFITLNGASLSTDMAQRSVIIKLVRPDRSGTWEDDVKRFIVENRPALIADIIGCLRAEPYKLERFTRWATWEAGVLSRLPEPSEAQAVIAERQGAVDVEEEEAGILEDFFADQLRRLRYDVDRDQVFIPSQVSARWHNWATNENAKTGAVSRMLNQLCTEGRLSRLHENKCKAWGRGFVWIGQNSDINATVYTDLNQRLAEHQAKGA